MKTFIIIWFACGQSNEKSGTDSGTVEIGLHEAYPKLVSQSVVIARKRKITLPSFRRLCPELLSRTLIAETVVFIGCPGVPRIVRIDSVSVRARETSLPDLARQARFQAGIGTEDHGSEDGGGIAHNARVAPRVRSGGEDVRRRTKGRSEGGKTAVFLPDSGGISPDLFQGRNKDRGRFRPRSIHINPQQRAVLGIREASGPEPSPGSVRIRQSSVCPQPVFAHSRR